MPKSQGRKIIDQSSAGGVALGSNHQSLPERRLVLFNKCAIQEMPRPISIHEAKIFDILMTKEPSEELMQRPAFWILQWR
jgi:hypothetical protein